VMIEEQISLVGLIVVIVLVLDQITKYVIQTHVKLHDTINGHSRFFQHHPCPEQGRGVRIASGLPEFWRSAFFITVTVIAVGVIIALIIKTRERLPLYAFSLIAAGAIGNVVDVIRYVRWWTCSVVCAFVITGHPSTWLTRRSPSA